MIIKELVPLILIMIKLYKKDQFEEIRQKYSKEMMQLAVEIGESHMDKFQIKIYLWIKNHIDQIVVLITRK